MLTCSRCGRSAHRLAAPPMPGEVGGLIQDHTCADCWQEWQAMEIKLINELRLNFMDPSAAGVLEQHLRDFLVLPASDG